MYRKREEIDEGSSMKDLQQQINQLHNCCDPLVPIQIEVAYKLITSYTVCVPVPLGASEGQKAAAISSVVSALNIPPDLTGTVEVESINWRSM